MKKPPFFLLLAFFCPTVLMRKKKRLFGTNLKTEKVGATPKRLGNPNFGSEKRFVGCIVELPWQQKTSSERKNRKKICLRMPFNHFLSLHFHFQISKGLTDEPQTQKSKTFFRNVLSNNRKWSYTGHRFYECCKNASSRNHLQSINFQLR